MTHAAFLAIDLGASSGRHVAGLFDGSRLAIEEIYRFENAPVAAAGTLYWNLLDQWRHVVHGLQAAGASGREWRSVGVDAWGVDFGLLGAHDELLANPVHYRDARTGGLLPRAFERVGREEIFAQTGLQFMPINTLYQLWSMRLADSAVLAAARRLLMMPDLFHWLLSGEKANEYTIATTTQFFDPRKKTWAAELLGRFDLPASLLGPIVQSGTTLGGLRPGIAAATGLGKLDVVAPGTHDTASAVLAVPAALTPALSQRETENARPDWCYISSGTWSLMGVELAEPIINDRALALNFTNEGGVGGTVRLLKNIGGLWLVQECRRVWKLQAHDYSWDELSRLAAAAAPLAALFDPDDASLLAPADMPEAIRALCNRTSQTPPTTPGAIVRAAIESLALKYRLVLGWLEELIGGRIETIHIVGGGTQNQQLCQATADTCERRVLAGPVEATAIGNLLMQAIAAGCIGSVAQAREVVRRSFEVEEYLPSDSARWREAFERFKPLVP